MSILNTTTPVQYVKGVGPKKAEALAALGIHTVYDLLLYLPFRYEDRSVRRKLSDIQDGEEATVEVEVLALAVKKTRRPNFKVIELTAKDDTGRLKAVWFNQEFLSDVMTPGKRVLLYGKFERPRFGFLPEVKSPTYEIVGEEVDETTHTGRIVPIYERVGALSPKVLRKVLHLLVMGMPRDVPEVLPANIRSELTLPSREQALADVHFPPDDADADELNRFRSPAQIRLIFEELFLFFLGLELRKREQTQLTKAISFELTDSIREVVRQILPFRLTEAQRRVVKEIADDLVSKTPMRRLVQGDVGAGKTIVAVLSALVVIENGAQVAFMVPTELLAEQHYANIQKLLAKTEYRIALLRSGLKKADKDALLADIASGQIQLVVGTHALIQQSVSFRRLGLAIIDEQHRFGVLQRAELRDKGFGCDLLVMTATPIPRTLTMAVYGDLDLSALDELPPGRQPIRTLRREAIAIDDVLAMIDSELERGHQCYFVCPLIEESDKSELRAAEERYRMLVEGPFANRRVAMVHGRMASAEREAVMQRFVAGTVDVLVSTTVVEVGVDVANATIMVVEHAERFGLAQLHQLRGRVGRGAAASTTVLLTHKPVSEEAERRLQAMLETQDGFVIAERDLAIRGPGDYFGTRQSGIPLFRIASVLRDRELFERARARATSYLVEADVSSESAQALLRHVVRVWGARFGLASAG